ncbi:MAG: hypothetical protein ACE1Y4_05155 [Lysobacterales bacterium]|nr:hypothetical protein [Nitrospirota bacterium]
MPQPFGLDPLALSPGKLGAFPLTLRERLIMQAIQEARRRRRGGQLPLPSPSLVEPLLPFGLFGETFQDLKAKTGSQPFHLPSQPNPSLRDLLTSLLQGGQFGI